MPSDRNKRNKGKGSESKQHTERAERGNDYIAQGNELDAILDAIHDDVLITNGNGIVVKVSSTFEGVYGINEGEALGKSVYELERKGIFSPSVTAIVLETGEKVTMSQKNGFNRDIVVTATPVFDSDGRIIKVVSFSRDVTDFLNLKEQYAELESKIEKYEDEIDKLKKSSKDPDYGIIAKDRATLEILETARRIAAFDTNVLITGESGVGKSLLAKNIHDHSNRADGPFIEISCGAIPENLLESELFGYEKGSFTGASTEGKIGLIELAEGGTLFLDEIGELPPALQVKLLKVIQDRVISRVGGVEELPVDFRLISATNKDLAQQMRKGEFREDLYYRLNVISIELPPLRERKADLVPLVAFFLEKINSRHGLNKVMSKGAYEVLSEYSWPGNVRELENVVERTILTTEGTQIKRDDVRNLIYDQGAYQPSDESLSDAIERVEGDLVRKAYSETKTTVGVAKALNISQPTAVRKIKKYIR